MAFAMTFSLSNGMIVNAAESNGDEELKVEYVDSFDGIVEKSLHTVSAGELEHEFGLQQNNTPDVSVSEENCIGEFQSGIRQWKWNKCIFF